ncbi:MAG TPA: hypothetical protein VE033_19225, partial [Acetobacteraceae bacterium]|nr:hypothetical protein [Acetobacteraceae bacterium]
MIIHAGQPVAEPTPSPPPRTAWTPAGYLLIEVRGEVPTAPGRGPAELLVGGARLLPPLLSFDVSGARLTLARATPACAEGATIEIRHGAEALHAQLGPPSPPAALLH